MTLADRLPPPDPDGPLWRERTYDVLHWWSLRRGHRLGDALWSVWDVVWFVGTRTRAYLRYQRDRLLGRR